MAGKVTDRRLSVAEVATDRQIEGASPERAAAPQGAPAEGAAGAPAIGNGRMGMAGEATERENGGSSVLRGRSNLRGSSDLRRRSVGTEGGAAAAPSCVTAKQRNPVMTPANVRSKTARNKMRRPARTWKKWTVWR
jgi:hypothetical protein